MKLIQMITIFLVTLSFSGYSLAINKCTDDRGKISFQDKSCPSASELKVIQPKSSPKTSKSNPKINIINVDVANGKTFSVAVPADWQDSIQQGESGAPTLRVASSNGEPLVLLMTFIPKRQSVGVDNVILNELMQGIADRHSKSKSERKIAVRKVDLVLVGGVGHLLTYIDGAIVKDTNRAADEFAIVTTGVLIIEGIVINVSVLTNDVRSDNYANAMIAVHTITN